MYNSKIRGFTEENDIFKLKSIYKKNGTTSSNYINRVKVFFKL